MGVVPKTKPIEAVIIHEKPPVDWSSISLLAIVVILVGAFFAVRATKQGPQTTRTQVSYQDRPLYIPAMANAIGRPKVDSHPHMTLASGSTPSKTATVQPDTDPADQDDSLDTADEPIQTPALQPASVVIGSAELESQNDGDGHEIAYGHVQVLNPSSHPITSLTILMSTNGGSYTLVPASGSGEMTIPAGGSLDIPVMSDGAYTALDPSTPKTIIVHATEDGTAVSSSTTIQ
jgi:hypothetical protein